VIHEGLCAFSELAGRIGEAQSAIDATRRNTLSLSSGAHSRDPLVIAPHDQGGGVEKHSLKTTILGSNDNETALVLHTCRMSGVGQRAGATGAGAHD
jgi:VCBS repeat-containing protein